MPSGSGYERVALAKRPRPDDSLSLLCADHTRLPVGPPAIGFGRLRSEQIEDEVLKNLGGANRAVFRRVRTTHGIHFGVAENHGIRLETSTFGARRPKRIAFGASNSGPLQHPGNRVAANFDVATGGGRQRQSITLHERQRHFRHVHK